MFWQPTAPTSWWKYFGNLIHVVCVGFYMYGTNAVFTCMAQMHVRPSKQIDGYPGPVQTGCVITWVGTLV